MARDRRRRSKKSYRTMADTDTTVATLRDAMRRFVAERDWEQFHSPKNLVMGLSVEAAELMEHFLWIGNEDSRQAIQDPAKLGEVADEMADVACYLLALSNTLGIDLSEAVLGKLVKNALKYPVEKCKGRYRVE
jgi:NTP pyrophosphatase (non-canonical NTP hydrolase)